MGKEEAISEIDVSGLVKAVAILGTGVTALGVIVVAPMINLSPPSLPALPKKEKVVNNSTPKKASVNPFSKISIPKPNPKPKSKPKPKKVDKGPSGYNLDTSQSSVET